MIQDPVQSNTLIIIGDDGICVVDAHYTPSAARETIAAIRRLSKLPVKYLVTTHWHDDHIFGNQEYRKAYPGVTIVAHEQTRAKMLARAADHRSQLITSYSRAVDRVQRRLERGADSTGQPNTPEQDTYYRTWLPILKRYVADFTAVQVTLPDLTFTTQVTLRLGEREVVVRSFGPGNTEGDVVVWLPRERLVATGDLVVYPVPFIYGGFPASWVGVLDSVRGLAPAMLLPGHGPVMHDYAYLDRVRCLLATLSSQVQTAKRNGFSLEEATAAVDLAEQRRIFVDTIAAREGTFASSILKSGIKAAFDEQTTTPPPPCSISDD
jgi:glyoxylase-like metal-dependent hydrolase (beta-lactamase superfamily II)